MGDALLDLVELLRGLRSQCISTEALVLAERRDTYILSSGAR
jgi:hypothetical protein